MSDGFASSSTKSIGSKTRMDVFTDDFSPPGQSGEQVPGANYTKSDNNYQDKHQDLAAAGKASDQEPLDRIDAEVQRREAQIKSERAQFPTGTSFDRLGRPITSGASDNAKFDKAQTDPMRLSAARLEVYKSLGLKFWTWECESCGYQIHTKPGQRPNKACPKDGGRIWKQID